MPGFDAQLAQQRRWIRPNAHLYIRHDAWRFMPPGSPKYVGKDVVKYCWPAQGGPLKQPRDGADAAAIALEIKELQSLKCELAAIRADMRFRRFLRALKAYNPDQPRVPAGSPDGGQWTNGPGTGGQSATQTVVGEDGSSIQIATSKSTVDGWDQRVAVTLVDGSVFTFQDSGPTQTVFNGNGQVLSRTIDLTGSETSVIPAQYVPAVPGPPGAILAAGAALYSYWSSQNGPAGQAVYSFRADAFAPGAAKANPAVRVDRLSEQDVDDACPRYAEVQSITDQAANAIDRGAYENAATYGTAVHQKIREEINGPTTVPSSPPRDPNFRAEISFIKSDMVRYGKRGSIRIDVLENSGKGTVCVYDIKTGESALSSGRSLELASEVAFYYPGTKRIVVTEVRPRR